MVLLVPKLPREEHLVDRRAPKSRQLEQFQKRGSDHNTGQYFSGDVSEAGCAVANRHRESGSRKDEQNGRCWIHRHEMWQETLQWLESERPSSQDKNASSNRQAAGHRGQDGQRHGHPAFLLSSLPHFDCFWRVHFDRWGSHKKPPFPYIIRGRGDPWTFAGALALPITSSQSEL